MTERSTLIASFGLSDDLLEAGAHGLGLFGNASEGYALSGTERRTLMEAIVHRVAGRVPLIVSSGHTGTHVAVEASAEARDMGSVGTDGAAALLHEDRR